MKGNEFLPLPDKFKPSKITLKALCQVCLKAIEINSYEESHVKLCSCGGELCACKDCQAEIELSEKEFNEFVSVLKRTDESLMQNI